MESSYTLSTQGAKRSARGCNETRRECIAPIVSAWLRAWWDVMEEKLNHYL